MTEKELSNCAAKAMRAFVDEVIDSNADATGVIDVKIVFQVFHNDGNIITADCSLAPEKTN